MKIRWIAIVAWALLPGAAAAQTDVWPDPVVKEDAFVVPLWLPQFTGTGDNVNKAQRLEQIVLQDLQFTGLFKIMREEPATAGVAGVNAVVVRGKVFLDYNMNARSKTLAAAYSPRAAAGAPVSVPIGWEELDEVVPQELTIHTVPARLAERGDPWEGILEGPADLAARLRAA